MTHENTSFSCAAPLTNLGAPAMDFNHGDTGPVGAMSNTDADLEADIQAAYVRMLNAKNKIAVRAAQAEMVNLIARRSPQRAAEASPDNARG